MACTFHSMCDGKQPNNSVRDKMHCRSADSGTKKRYQEYEEPAHSDLDLGIDRALYGQTYLSDANKSGSHISIYVVKYLSDTALHNFSLKYMSQISRGKRVTNRRKKIIQFKFPNMDGYTWLNNAVSKSHSYFFFVCFSLLFDFFPKSDRKNQNCKTKLQFRKNNKLQKKRKLANTDGKKSTYH